ncbi:hypothetical protein JW964_12790 [candidate division KSB1 bacterium]|nr:hypothetical protein [candidate division KSB1 bacterium]
MKPISARIVEKIRIEMSQSMPVEIPEIIEQFADDQPLILAFLMSAYDDILNQVELEALLYLGVAVWKMMRHGRKIPAMVTEKRLDEVEATNLKMLEYLDGESERDFENTVRMIIDNYNQVEVLRFVIEELMEESEDDEDFRDENIGIMMIALKTVIDCLDS